MTVIQVSDIAFGYTADKLFQGVTFSLALGERAALVAPNGAGKTTLLRIVAGELAPDTGSVTPRRDTRIGFYRQSHELSLEGTVLEALLSGFQDVVALRHELGEARRKAASGTQADLDSLARLEDRYHLVQGDELERRVEVIAHKLGFGSEQMDRPVASLSGGERGRMHLGLVLAQSPDILLLDEPTNHLDLDTIDWLEKFLVGYAGAVLLVSHDRAFLDNVCPRTLELGHRTFRVYAMPYSQYTVAREEELARERDLVERQQSQIAKTEEFIRKNLAGQKTKQAQSRRKALEKLERMDRPEDVFEIASKMSFRFAPAPRTGEIVLEATGLQASRGGRPLYEGFELLVRRLERVGIVGPNGSGKTTLLKHLAGQCGPDDQGSVRRGSNLCDGFFDQELGSLNPQHNGIDEIRGVRADMNVDTTRGYLARFRFWGDQPFQTVAGLSGGERSRLALAKLLLEPRNLLFLDEPTNHLDIPAAEILEEALINFDGTVVFVSHDRRFLENVSTRVVAFHEGRLEVYQGGYRDWTRRGQAPVLEDPDDEPAQVTRSAPPPAPADSESQRTARKAQFEAAKAAARTAQRKQRRVKELEDLVAQGESKLSEMREQLRAAAGDDWESLSRLAQEEQALARKVEALMNEWTELSEELANEQATLAGVER
ncbi:MAG: ABC-F family ATP-binding cassette domain-containing protein [Deltaproteobacteria bacterium]|nr:ABC-F family ATP-binding cassette domain-containing protein [Deltaproteobacteria bacterium]